LGGSNNGPYYLMESERTFARNLTGDWLTTCGYYPE